MWLVYPDFRISLFSSVNKKSNSQNIGLKTGDSACVYLGVQISLMDSYFLTNSYIVTLFFSINLSNNYRHFTGRSVFLK